MESDETRFRYPYLISVRRGRPVPARRDGSNYVCAYPVFLGRWWPLREVQVLEYDPHRDFYREQRQTQAVADRGPAPQTAPSVSEGAATAPDADGEVAVWERVEGPGPRPAAPSTARSVPYVPRRAWGR